MSSVGLRQSHSDGNCGRPRQNVSKEEIEHLLSLKTTLSDVASILGISRPTLNRLMREYQITGPTFSTLSDEQLDAAVCERKIHHPHVGEVMLNGHLRSRGIFIQRNRLRQSLKRVDSHGIEARRSRTIQRRLYSVPCPNYLWHIDGNHKLIRWKLVVHGAMDGFSRMVMFLWCSNNNRADTVKHHFRQAVSEFGRPLHVRTDHGGENVHVWEDMCQTIGEGSVFTGSSVHNQRIERFNRDLNRNCSQVYAPVFYDLESMHLLDLDNKTDLFSLHYVYLPRVNHTLNEFRAAYNNHSVSSEGNRTPLQLFMGEKHLLYIHNPHAEAEERAVPSQPTSAPPTNETFCPLNEGDLQELSLTIDPLANDHNHGKTFFQRVQEFIYNKLSNSQ
ncbi:hypothetical protein HHUSO_G23946 [Huso huso]|uniref:Integrase catalytic domain-containing protein n=1 Tax=Huso huso TaxID=61971 RepID=A0ABR0YU16_HUSHU